MKDKTKQLIGYFLIGFLIFMLFQFISDWIINVAMSLVGLWKLIELLEMPHKFYGLTIILFISWKLLEAVIDLWFKGMDYSIKLIKSSQSD